MRRGERELKKGREGEKLTTRGVGGEGQRPGSDMAEGERPKPAAAALHRPLTCPNSWRPLPNSPLKTGGKAAQRSAGRSAEAGPDRLFETPRGRKHGRAVGCYNLESALNLTPSKKTS